MFQKVFSKSHTCNFGSDTKIHVQSREYSQVKAYWPLSNIITGLLRNKGNTTSQKITEYYEANKMLDFFHV